MMKQSFALKKSYLVISLYNLRAIFLSEVQKLYLAIMCFKGIIKEIWRMSGLTASKPSTIFLFSSEKPNSSVIFPHTIGLQKKWSIFRLHSKIFPINDFYDIINFCNKAQKTSSWKEVKSGFRINIRLVLNESFLDIDVKASPLSSRMHFEMLYTLYSFSLWWILRW